MSPVLVAASDDLGFVAVLLLAKASQIYSFRANPSPRPVRRTQVIKHGIALRGDIDVSAISFRRKFGSLFGLA